MALLLVDQSLAADIGRNLVVNQVNSPVSDKRIALVIGNSTYSGNTLLTPANDAQDVAAKLRTMGFDVIERENLQVKQIYGTLNEFRAKLVPGATALVFYAGHGIQINGENYLPAVDAEIAMEKDVYTQSIAMWKLMALLDEAKTRFNLVFLDASRDNSYTHSFQSATGKGLARISTHSGTLVSFSTLPGSVVADGDGRNGLYASKLIEQMGANLRIESALRQVVSGVKSVSQGLQEPWVEGLVEGEFCLDGCGHGGQIVPPEKVIPSNLSASSVPSAGEVSQDAVRQKKEKENQDSWSKWQAAMKAAFDKVATFTGSPGTQVAAWERFLAGYSQDNPYSGEARQLRAQAQSKKLDAEKRKREAESAASAPAPAPLVEQASATQRSNALRDCPDCPEMMMISEGSFDMGSRSAEPEHRNNEFPLHRVSIKAFAIGKHEVTVGQFATFIGESGYDAGKDCDLFYSNARKDGNWRDTGFPQNNNQPVVCVNWNDAQAYVRWLSKKTGKEYRLPTEAEWEYAARAGTATTRYWGNDAGRNNANCVGCGSQWDNKQTSPVGSFAPNAFGLYDMLGNAMEWTQDCFNGSYLGSPTTGNAWVAGDCGRRVQRGGSWMHDPRLSRSASRYWGGVAFRSYLTGFRLARSEL